MINQSRIFTLTGSSSEHYIDKGRSILRFFFRACRICFVIFMHRSSSNVTHIKTNASCICLKYSETAEETRNARTMSSHITKITISTLEAKLLWEVEEKKDAEAQSCLDRI
uniref:Uncharacterized protein n=1 Tax=Opuntia streptacantha TaxID=393608 RepID=A0A7C9E1K2_OPUST